MPLIKKKSNMIIIKLNNEINFLFYYPSNKIQIISVDRVLIVSRHFHYRFLTKFYCIARDFIICKMGHLIKQLVKWLVVMSAN